MLSLRFYLYLTSFIFFVVGILHGIRLIFQLSIVLAGYTIPLWVSIFGALIPLYLASSAFTLARKQKK